MHLHTGLVKYIEICSRNSWMRFEELENNTPVLIFDMDDCLWQNEQWLPDYFEQVKKYYFTIAPSSATEEDWDRFNANSNLFRKSFYEEFGVPMVDYDRANDVIDIEKYIPVDYELVKLFESIKYPIFCFTNGSVKRAEKVLKYMQIEQYFNAVFCGDCVDTEFLRKPMPEAYEFVENFIGAEFKQQLYFFDDSIKNIRGAVNRGWNGIQVTADIKQFIIDTLETIAVERESDNVQDECVNDTNCELLGCGN